MASRNLAAQLEQFRKKAQEVSKLKDDASKARSEKLAKKAAVKRATGGPRKPRATKSGAAGSEGPSGSGAPSASEDWKTQLNAPSTVQIPVGMRIKQVLEFLRSASDSQTVQAIQAATGHRINSEDDLRAALSNNPKIGIDDEGLYFYRPDSNVRNRGQLLELIRRSAAPVAVSEVADAYSGVNNDIAGLKADNMILSLFSYDPEIQGEVLYPSDVRLNSLKPVDDDVAALWANCVAPADDEVLVAELRTAGIVPAARNAPRKNTKSEKKRKQRQQRKLRAVTNIHLIHLLEGNDAPTQID